MGEPYRDRLPADGDPGSGEIITIARYGTTIEAEMSREYLKAHGVEAFTHDAAGFNPLVNAAAGGAQLLVSSSDEARARFFLERAERSPTTSREEDEEEGDVRCPRCELTYCFQERAFDNDVQETAFRNPFLSLFTLPFSSRRKRWRCHKCLYVWDDAKEGPKRATSLQPDDPRPVFRWRSHRSGTGLILGLIVMFGMCLAAGGAGAEGALFGGVFCLGILVVMAGHRVGRRSISDVCSAPHCRAVLPQGEEECASCHGSIVGVIDFAHEHYAKTAEFRRELRALAVDDEKRAKKSKAKKRRAQLEAKASRSERQDG